MTKKSQSELILEHLERGFSITPIIALDLFNCFRLGARIHELKKKHNIVNDGYTTLIGTRVASYRLIKEKI